MDMAWSLRCELGGPSSHTYGLIDALYTSFLFFFPFSALLFSSLIVRYLLYESVSEVSE